MDQLVLKTEVQSNGEILLFYVDENGDNEEGVVTTVENIEHQALQLEQGNYVIEDQGQLSQISIPQTNSISDIWTDENIKQLLIFYTDNKHTFISGTTKRQHLWTVACRTMLIGKTPDLCELKLEFLRQKYIEIIEKVQTGIYVEWDYFELCHRAFSEDLTEETFVNDDYKTEINIDTSQEIILDNSNLLRYTNKYKPTQPKVDDKVILMLNLYLKYKKEFEQAHWTKNLWEMIAAELGDDDGEYWQKRFLNYKQHYLRLLDKVAANASENINWPYWDLFNKIFEGNVNKRQLKTDSFVENNVVYDPHDWNSTEITVLVKYCFDCFDEFQDYTIPDKFLWGEIGRLLDKDADDCKAKYEELKETHFEKYYQRGYDVKVRKPIEILFDSIITKEVELQIAQPSASNESWSQEDLDSLVQFIYENSELFKEQSSHFVCWAAVAKKMGKNTLSCRLRWNNLVNDYKSILESKKEYPDLQIQWRFIDLFDRIFDFGMNTNLLAGFEASKVQEAQPGGKIGVKKVKIKMDYTQEENSEDDDEYIDERGIRRRNKRRPGESKAIKILEYYLKNKDKFSTTNRNKHSLWEILAKQIGISATQCAHRFRNLKQVYTAYVRREINKPDMPILWPYYALCKKVFGYRAIKNKLKNGMIDSDETEEWTAKEIKILINYFAANFNSISNNEDDLNVWSNLTKEISKTENACKEKFLELRKSYRKLKTMRNKNPSVKIMWKYFNMFEVIYKFKDGGDMDVDENLYMEIPNDSDDTKIDEEDYQCIIVMPEGEDMIENSQILQSNDQNLQTLFNNTETNKKWTKKTKKKLLINYINYLRMNKGKDINPKEMWSHIGSKLEKTPIACKRMFLKMKSIHKQIDASDMNAKTPYYTLMEKVMRLKPKYIKTEENSTLNSSKIYKDVNLPNDKVEQALKYYLDNLESFLSPKFEKKYLWTELANTISEPVTKIFNKINFLKQNFNPESTENFSELLKEILENEIVIKQGLPIEVPIIEENEASWTDSETEKLLEWYLSNLDKFKNPKFVRSYLWQEVSGILNKSAISCSKKMSEIRSQYRNMVRTTDTELKDWKFLELCLKIYGTGKKNE